jgi:steroid 5-alpha reductase family enzyme
MASAGDVMLLAGAVALGLMIGVWLLSLWLKDASIVDSFWGLGFVAIAWVAYAAGDGWQTRGLLVAGLVTAWGLRLSVHIARRNVGKPEDYRYVAMRRKHGSRFWLVSLGTVFILQAAIMWVVSLPVQMAQVSAMPDHLTVLDVVGTLVFLAGLGFEAIGDLQLERFKADESNSGRVMDRGLWRYTRHPNYFGDATVWWGLFLITVSHTEYWWTVVGPAMMTFFLTRVSGVPLLERRMARTRPGYAQYVERTSGFIPLPPKATR